MQGARCTEGFADAATRFAQQLVKYEGVEGPVVSVSQGQEPPEFWECLGQAAAAGDRTSDAASPRENSTYDKDFEVGWQCIAVSLPCFGFTPTLCHCHDCPRHVWGMPEVLL